MARILTGKEVAEALNVRKSADVEKLKLRGIIPTLCIFRVGNRADDISYEKGAMKRAAKIGVAVKQIILPEDVREDVFEAELKKANEDPLIHGILLFRPLPPQLDGEKARRMLNPAKDIDGCIVLVNSVQTGKHAKLKDGDTVMLMSPVCGG